MVLLSAVVLQRIGFGLLLIVAFLSAPVWQLCSSPSAFYLIVYAQRFMSRFHSEGHLIARWLPLTSAALITAFDVVMTGQALVSTGILTFHLESSPISTSKLMSVK